MAQRRGFPVRNPSRRVKTWSLGPENVDLSQSGSGAQLWSAGGQLANETQITILRLRGFQKITLLTATAAGDGFFGATGFGLVTNEAFAIGVTAVPSPLSEEEWDGWLFHTYWGVQAAVAAGVDTFGTSFNLEIDSKAMRKWSDGYTLIGINDVVEKGTAVVEYQGSSRLLALLS